MPHYEFRVTSPLLKRIRDQAVVNVNMQKHDLHGFLKKSRIWFLNEINIIVVNIVIFRLPVGQWY